MPDDTAPSQKPTLTDRVRAICRVFELALYEDQRARSGWPLDSEERQGPPVQGDTR